MLITIKNKAGRQVASKTIIQDGPGNLEYRASLGEPQTANQIIMLDGKIVASLQINNFIKVVNKKYEYITIRQPIYEQEDRLGPVDELYFNLDKHAGLGKTRVQFYPRNTDYEPFFLWDFGDGTTSFEQYPSKLYEKPGVYNVTLKKIDPTKSPGESGYVQNEKTIKNAVGILPDNRYLSPIINLLLLD